MRVFIRTPYSIEKNLGKAYNEEMELLPEDSAACFIDGDCMFTRSDFGTILHQYVNDHPNAVLTCWINRIHELAKGQLLPQGGDADLKDVRMCLHVAKLLDKDRTATQITGSVSGTLLVIPKHIWNEHKFTETNAYRPNEPNLLGVDNDFTNRVRAAGIPVLRMDAMLIYHQYRLLTGTKTHLL